VRKKKRRQKKFFFNEKKMRAKKNPDTPEKNVPSPVTQSVTKFAKFAQPEKTCKKPTQF
jgi:hypothetical protein